MQTPTNYKCIMLFQSCVMFLKCKVSWALSHLVKTISSITVGKGDNKDFEIWIFKNVSMHNWIGEFFVRSSSHPIGSYKSIVQRFIQYDFFLVTQDRGSDVKRF